MSATHHYNFSQHFFNARQPTHDLITSPHLVTPRPHHLTSSPHDPVTSSPHRYLKLKSAGVVERIKADMDEFESGLGTRLTQSGGGRRPGPFRMLDDVKVLLKLNKCPNIKK